MRRILVLLLLGVVVSPRRAEAWGTAEHVRFGMVIAEPYEGYLGEKLPVIVASTGPRTFGHYVSAPDFARGLARLLFERAVVGPIACGVNWNPEGVIDGAAVDDQTHADTDDTSFLDKAGMPDCVNTWQLNNSHFGDFAANHFTYYHALAIEAARRYRATRQPACRAAAYTLEGWGQHYLTDSTAAGHAFNPPGDYDLELGFQTLNGLDTRLRIHNFLNDNGARMSGRHYADGVYWGDHSETHTADRRSIPEHAAGDPQRDLTLRLARMALGQVVATAECGDTSADPRAVLDHDAQDRRLYASNESMCKAMYGHEFRWWLPDFVDTTGIDLQEVEDAIVQCKADEGAMTMQVDGAALARHYFPDKLPLINEPMEGFISPTIDKEAQLSLEELDCFADADVVPLTKPDEHDICGNRLCERPIAADGTCRTGSVVSGGCCAATRDFDGGGSITASAWIAGPRLTTSELDTPGAVPGGASELLPLADTIPVFAGQAALAPLVSESTTLAGGTDLPTCGSSVSYTVYEALVRIPAAADLRSKVVTLAIHEMDEGLRVQVDGHAVAYVTAGNQQVHLIAPAATGDLHVIRLTHVNSCATARPLRVALSIDDKADGEGAIDDDGGCTTSRSTGFELALALLGIGALRRRRRSRS